MPSDLNDFITKLHRAELRTAQYLLKKFTNIPVFIDTDCLKIQLEGSDLGDNEADIIEDALHLYVEWMQDSIKRDKRRFRK